MSLSLGEVQLYFCDSAEEGISFHCEAMQDNQVGSMEGRIFELESKR